MTFYLTTLAAWVHDIDPYMIKLWEGGPIRWYGMSYLLGFVLAYLLIRRVASAGVSTLEPQRVGDLIVAVAIGVIVGGRLGYAVFYQQNLLGFDGQFPYWGVFRLWDGGMASHGGLIGLIVACMIFARKHHHSMGHLFDLCAFAGSIGLFFGRIANFINGELYGRECAADFPLAVKFPQELGEKSGMSQELYTQLAPLVPKGVASVADWVVVQVQSGNEQVRQIVEPFLTPRHPSQLYQAALEGLLVFIVLVILWARPRKPFVICGAWCISYGVMRVVGEFFRMPDAHIANQEFAVTGITRGQWLSFGVIVLGVIALIVSRRGHVAPMGGWRRAADK